MTGVQTCALPIWIAAAGGSESSKDYVDDMYTLLNKYSSSSTAVAGSAQNLAAELGTMIANMDFRSLPPPHVQAEADTVVVNIDAAEEEDSVFPAAVADQVKFATAASAVAAEVSSDQFIETAVAMQSYRRAAGLNATFSPQKIAKQMLLAQLLPPKGGAAAAVVEPVLGRNQTDGLAPSSGKVSLEALPLDYSRLAAGECIRDQAVVDFINGYKLYHPTQSDLTPQQFLQGVIDVYSTAKGKGSLDDRFKRAYLKKYPQPSEAIIKAIVSL